MNILVNTVWRKFQGMFNVLNGLMDYLPIYRVFHWRLLEEIYEDNVMFMEMRTGMGSVKHIYVILFLPF